MIIGLVKGERRRLVRDPKMKPIQSVRDPNLIVFGSAGQFAEIADHVRSIIFRKISRWG